MAAVTGRNVQFKIGDAASPEVFTNVGARAVAIRINGQLVEITDNNSSGWREALSGGGVRSLSVTIQGAFRAGTHELLLRTKADTQALFNGQAILGDGSVKYSGQWQCTQYEDGGQIDGAQAYQATLESSGTMTLA